MEVSFAELLTKKDMVGFHLPGEGDSNCDGKTSILKKLKRGKIVESRPLGGFRVESAEYDNISFTALGSLAHGSGRDPPHLQPLLTEHSGNRDRALDDRDELYKMLNEDQLRDAVLLVFANKKDLPNAMSAAEITDKLGLQSLRRRHWYIQSICATSGEGLHEGTLALQQYC